MNSFFNVKSLVFVYNFYIFKTWWSKILSPQDLTSQSEIMEENAKSSDFNSKSCLKFRINNKKPTGIKHNF